MKKLIILLIIGIFTIPINAQQTQANFDYLERAKKRIGFGATFTLIGVGTMIGGAVVYVNGINGIENSATTQDIWDNFNAGMGGVVIMAVGEILIDVGLPFWIVGGVQKARAKRNMKLSMVQFKVPNSHTSVNGIGLTIRF
jgi:hypothetical protein